ncbi:LPS assembly lipoprotein LptE [Amphritea sp. 1_MG-2023]|uniref:LPS-assembly lipoprotein LptE n=1 Tax=Amphritea sp. 1_MG-2023 TaxID=3062670 RepID=UPI0026E2A54D|nr:LPS assembly lipoprotein LptE [Amphritea sp. 1_MG-2023]MDO6565047.1 LPS assembly lipoprotein LptE [Amphritea sp. 1_MG-2023]
MTRCQSRLSVTVFFTACCLLLSACGFHLRGNADLAEPLRQVTLVSPERSRSQLAPVLRRLLEANGVSVNHGTGYLLQIISEKRSRREATLGADADIDEYELTTRVSFLVKDTQGDIVLERHLAVDRIYDYDTDKETASNAQEAQLYDEMDQQLARQILRFYANVKPTTP